MGRVIRDWRLANRPIRRQRYGQPRATNAECAVRIDGSFHEGRDPKRLHRILGRSALVVLPLVLLVVWVWSLGAQRRAIYALPPDERAVVYADTLEAFDAACVPPKAGLTAHCRSQASFLLSFPECDEHCRGVAAPLLHWRNS